MNVELIAEVHIEVHKLLVRNSFQQYIDKIKGNILIRLKACVHLK